MTEPATIGRLGSVLLSAGNPSATGKTVRAITAIGVDALVITAMTPLPGHADLSGVTIPLGVTVWTSASAVSITSGLGMGYYGRPSNA
jgi:hypothetical protein